MVVSADLIAAGDHSGRSALRRATIPAICGADIDVPERMVKPLSTDGSRSEVAAIICTPGAAMSGYLIGE